MIFCSLQIQCFGWRNGGRSLPETLYSTDEKKIAKEIQECYAENN
jgi:hypothetical protein